VIEIGSISARIHKPAADLNSTASKHVRSHLFRGRQIIVKNSMPIGGTLRNRIPLGVLTTVYRYNDATECTATMILEVVDMYI